MTNTHIPFVAVVIALLSIHPLFTAGIPGIQSRAVAQSDLEKAQASQKAAEAASAAAAKAAQDAAKSKADAEKAKEAAEKAAKEAAKADASTKKPKSYAGEFVTPMLADDAVNELKIPVPPSSLLQLPDNDKSKRQVEIKWTDLTATFFGSKTILGKPVCAHAEKHDEIRVLSKRTIKDDNENVVLLVRIPPRPCRWPLYQNAEITIQGQVVGEGDLTTLFHGTVPISGKWIPMLTTWVVIALFYPGCAMGVWFMRQRRYDRKSDSEKRATEPPDLWTALDPVQITANQHGRASLAKLQIFGFSFVVFGLLLYNQLRFGLLAGMSEDVLLLMGISAVGAVGGKITYTRKRRISLEAWSWLTARGWLPRDRDVQPRARWSELVLDGDSREFDPYSFQMAIFSLVVAFALLGAGLTGLGGLASFVIPKELLALLGLSQVVFIGGKASEASPFEEVEKKVTEAKSHEDTYLRQMKDETKRAEAPKELEAFKASARQAGEMFWTIYREQLPQDFIEKAKENIAKVAEGQAPPIAPAA